MARNGHFSDKQKNCEMRTHQDVTTFSVATQAVPMSQFHSTGCDCDFHLDLDIGFHSDIESDVHFDSDFRVKADS